MRKDKNQATEHDDGSYVVKKSRKSSVFAFILCVALAFVLWAYAEADQKQKAADLSEVVEAVAENAVSDTDATTYTEDTTQANE